MVHPAGGGPVAPTSVRYPERDQKCRIRRDALAIARRARARRNRSVQYWARLPCGRDVRVPGGCGGGAIATGGRFAECQVLSGVECGRRVRVEKLSRDPAASSSKGFLNQLAQSSIIIYHAWSLIYNSGRVLSRLYTASSYKHVGTRDFAPPWTSLLPAWSRTLRSSSDTPLILFQAGSQIAELLLVGRFGYFHQLLTRNLTTITHANFRCSR